MLLAKKSDYTFIASLFPETVLTEDANSELLKGALYPEEEVFIYNAVPKRRREFIAGRLCARMALRKIGIKNFPLLMAKDRTPVWPSNVVGSISHTKGYCGVAVAQKTEVQNVGLDVECIRDVSRECWKLICTQQELFRINSLPLNNQQKNAALIFSAKECLYKCQYPLTKQWVNFCDVEITVNPDGNEFKAKFLVDIGSFFTEGSCLKGKYLFKEGYVFTGMTIK